MSVHAQVHTQRGLSIPAVELPSASADAPQEGARDITVGDVAKTSTQRRDENQLPYQNFRIPAAVQCFYSARSARFHIVEHSINTTFLPPLFSTVCLARCV